MKILIIEDTKAHQDEARKQLGSTHDLTIIGSFEELMQVGRTNDTMGLDEVMKLPPYATLSRALRGYDVIMTDMMMPSPQAIDGYVLTESGVNFKKVYPLQPIGLAIAQVALKTKAKIAIVSRGHDDDIIPWDKVAQEIPGRLWTFIGDKCPWNGLKDWAAALELMK